MCKNQIGYYYIRSKNYVFVGNTIIQHPILFQERLLLMFRDMYASAVLNAKSVVIHIYFQTQK